MKRNATIFALILIGVGIMASAQGDKKNNPRLNFMRATLFSDFAHKNGDSRQPQSFAVAGNAFFAGGYGGADASAGLGWMCSAQIGYGRLKDSTGYSQTWMPYTVDLGFVGYTKLGSISDIGFHYAFGGIYGYSQTAFVGSACSFRLRIWRLQGEYGREGEGIFRGCFKPKYETYPVQHFTLLFIPPARWSGGIRFAGYDNYMIGSGDPFRLKEIRFFIAYMPGLFRK